MVERRVRQDFGKSAATILTALDRYGVEQYHREIERVQMAILKLSGGKWDSLEHWVKAATGDYRDVLLYAEYPSSARPAASNTLPPADARRAAQMDAEAYAAWLREVATD